MRSLMGWRFIIAIAVPILLASLGVLSLTTDLLGQVSANANRAESNRNRTIVQNALKAAESDLGRLALQNAHWDDAAANTYPNVNLPWFNATWGSMNSLGSSYDIVAVVDRQTAYATAYADHRGVARPNVAVFLGPTYRAMMEGPLPDKDKPGTVTTFATALEGPAIIAVSPILFLSQAGGPEIPHQRYLVLARLLDGDFTAKLQARSALSNLSIGPVKGHSDQALVVNSLSGQAAFGVVWKDRNAGMAATQEARNKANLVLGFLMLVMGGIAFVCWRLIRSVAANEQLALHQARHDPLTEMPNRAALVKKLKDLNTGRPHSYAVAYADLDGFKDVNDSFGHQVGDRLLRAVGVGFARLAGSSTMASRMGGDEFVVLFEGEDAQSRAEEFAGHFQRFLARPFDIDGCVASVGASLGIAVSHDHDDDELDILRRADVAMYRAKTGGRKRYCVYDPSFDVERLETQAIASELRSIVDTKSIDIAFQPVIRTRDMRISGVEALARWPKFSEREIVPDRFIAVAETSGLIDELGELILDKVCAAAKAWPDLRLSVNISAVQLNNPYFVQRAMAIIENHGISTRRIEFEITETSLIRDAERAKQVFKELQRYGIKIALDDFGTGFSSIGYLRTFSFDRIKIDKSIISKVLTNPAEMAIVQGTLLVARGLSAEVTAEGVERDEEAAVLKLAGCTELQGFHFHRPMPAADIAALLERAKPVVATRMAG